MNKNYELSKRTAILMFATKITLVLWKNFDNFAYFTVLSTLEKYSLRGGFANNVLDTVRKGQGNSVNIPL
jgi:hypothetical protein